jgi:hypothetical protein
MASRFEGRNPRRAMWRNVERKDLEEVFASFYKKKCFLFFFATIAGRKRTEKLSLVWLRHEGS